MPQPAIDPAIRDNLGSKVSALMQTYNDMKAALKDQPEATRAQFDALLEKRRAAVEAIFAQHRATLDAILGQGQAKLGALTPEVNLVQDQLSQEQSKFTALQTYFDQYKAALAAGQTPPPLPPVLQEGSFGISATTLAVFVALAAGAYFWWSKGD
jgi:chromosome segregation ATPase